MNRKNLELKYSTYRAQGASVFAVTLSTFVKSESFARSDRMRNYWDYHFIYRVRQCLPMHAKLDHDWVLEESPDGYFHYHGLLALEAKYEHRLWRDNDLCMKLKRAIDSHATPGKYRYFGIKEYLIEPASNISSWCNYITKQAETYE